MTAERIVRKVVAVNINSRPRSVTLETKEGKVIKKEVRKGSGERQRITPEVKGALDVLRPLAKEVILRKGLPLTEDDIAYFDKLEGERGTDLYYQEARRLACVTLGRPRNRIGSAKAAELILRQNPELLTRLSLGSETREGFELAVQDFAAEIVRYYPRNFPASAASPRK